MYYVLDIPWGFKYPGIQYWKDRKIYVYQGTILPKNLRQYRSQDFSYNRWQEDELNAMVLPPEKGNTVFEPKEHQIIAAKKIYKSYYNNFSGFLLADLMGLGKTLSSLVGITAIAKKEGFQPQNKAKLLIVCPLRTIPQWRQTIHNYPFSTAITRPMIINYQQMNKLLNPPSNARVVKKQRTKNRQIATKGTPTIEWDFIIFDESHYLKNYPKSAASLSATSLAGLNKKYVKGKSPFCVFVTATPGASPLNLAIMSKFIAPLITNSPEAKNITPGLWAPFLEKHGFAITKGKRDYYWAQLPSKSSAKTIAEKAKYEINLREAKILQRRDSQRIGKALTTKNAPFIMRSPKNISGWPEQQKIPLPIELTPKQQEYYKEIWSVFRKFLSLTPPKKDPQGTLAQIMRYRQKASLLRVNAITDVIIDQVENNKQVYVSCEFLETIDRLKENLLKKKIKVCEISGRYSSKEGENNRIAFQKGKYSVVLCTVYQSISLHADETLPDGTKATSNDRVTILMDMRTNNLSNDQALGRAHRDGKNSVAYIPFIEGTIDERIAEQYANKTANMKSMLGANLNDAEELENMFRQAAAKITPPNHLS